MIVLAIGAHPDDLEISSAGTLAKLRRDGHEVHLCHATRGDKGHYEIPAEELIEIRRAEARAAAALIDAPCVELGLSDGEVQAGDRDTQLAFVALIRAVRPDMVITHAPTDYMPDHVAVSELVFKTTFLATLPGFGDAPVAERPPAIFYMDNLAGVGFEPTIYVDVSETFDTKLEMLRCHRSQSGWLREHDGVDIESLVTSLGRTRGYQAGCGFAEGFVQHMAWARPNTIRLPA